MIIGAGGRWRQAVGGAAAGVLVAASLSGATGRGERLAAVEAHLDAGETPAALEQLRALEAEFPADGAVEALMGRALVQDRQFAAAETRLEAALDAGHGDFGTRLTLAAVLWENGKLEAAARRYEEACELSNDDPAALYPLARLLLWRGEPAAALPLLERVRQARPHWTEAALDLARALEQSGRPEEALSQAAAFVAASPEHAEGLYTLATIYRQLGRDDDAAATLERFARVQREDRERTLVRGRRRVDLESIRRRIDAGETAAALDRLEMLAEDVETLRLTARALELEGRSAEALRALERAVALDPSRTDVRVELQDAYRRLGGSP